MSDTNSYAYCNVVGRTDVGCKRPANEDWYGNFECKNGLVAVVCDGMGGHVGGREASHLAVESIRRFLESNYFNDPNEAIIRACDVANESILRCTAERPELTGMGSTCVMLIVRDGKVYIGSVGDSRIYLIRSKRIIQLTKDQSFVQMLVDRGEITKEQAEHHPRKNEITNALGLPSMQPATVLGDAIIPEAGDCFLLCSDGLSGMMSDDEILKVVSNQGGMSQQERVDMLIQRARKNGGYDNITAQLVEFAVTPSAMKGTNGGSQALLRYGLPGLVLLLLLCGGGFWAWKHFMNPGEKPSDEGGEIPAAAIPDRDVLTAYDDTLYYKAGQLFMRIEENATYGALDIRLIKKGTPDIKHAVQRPLKLDSLDVQPKEHIKILRQGTKCELSFIDKPFEGSTLSLRFNDGDSTRTFVFNVQTGEESVGSNTDDQKEPDTKIKTAKPGSRVSIIHEASDEDRHKQIHGNEVTVTVPRTGTWFTVHLISRDRVSTNDTVYANVVIKECEVDGGWYKYTCTYRDACRILINIKKMPKASADAYIDIPLDEDNEYFRIRVKKSR